DTRTRRYREFGAVCESPQSRYPPRGRFGLWRGSAHNRGMRTILKGKKHENKTKNENFYKIKKTRGGDPKGGKKKKRKEKKKFEHTLRRSYRYLESEHGLPYSSLQGAFLRARATRPPRLVIRIMLIQPKVLAHLDALDDAHPGPVVVASFRRR